MPLFGSRILGLRDLSMNAWPVCTYLVVLYSDDRCLPGNMEACKYVRKRATAQHSGVQKV
jgi:hypothetical protein